MSEFNLKHFWAQVNAVSARAQRESWVTAQNHCVARILLDNWCRNCWYDVLDVRQPSLPQISQYLSPEQMLRDLLSLDRQSVIELNKRSREWHTNRVQEGATVFIQVGSRYLKRGQYGLVVRRQYTSHNAPVQLQVENRQHLITLRSLQDHSNPHELLCKLSAIAPLEPTGLPYGIPGGKELTTYLKRQESRR